MARQARKGRKKRTHGKQPEGRVAEQEVERLFRALAAAEGEIGAVEAELHRLQEGGLQAFAHIARKLAKVGPQEQHLLVQAIKRAGSPELVRELAKSLPERDISLAVRVELVALLREAGIVPDPQLASAVEQAYALVQRAAPTLEQEAGDEALGPVVADLAALPKSTARMALEELARTDVPRALAVFRALARSHADDLDYPLLTVQALDGVLHEEAARYLSELLGESEARTLQKSIRRALYRLKLAGVHTAAPKERASVLTAPEFRFVAAHASHIDGVGNRSFHVAKAKPFGGVHLIFVSINDRKGVLGCVVAELNKREYDDVRRKIVEEGVFVDMEPSYAVAQVRAAAAKNRLTGTALPPEYVTNQRLLGGQEPTAGRIESPIYSELDAEELAALPTRLNDSAHLFEREEFADWKLPADDMAPYLYDYEEVEESRIIVSDELKQERLEEVYRKAAAGLMAGELREILKGRLEEMAHVLRQKGEKPWGSVALAAAVALEGDSTVPPEKHPFVLELVRKSTAAASKETRDRLIARPGEEGSIIT